MTDPNFAEQAQAAVAIGGAGIAGRLVWALRQTQAGRRRFFSAATLIDVIIAVPCAYLGLAGIELLQGLGWLGAVTPSVTAAACGVAGYLGPHAIDSLFGVLVRRADKA